MKQGKNKYAVNLLWIGEVVKDLLVEDVKYHIQKVPANFINTKVAIKTTAE